MIKKVKEQDIPSCVTVIRESFLTVANALGFTVENAPGFTAFATTEDRLKWHMFGEHRPMFAFYDQDAIVGYYSLLWLDDPACELNNLCVLPSHRHRGIGKALLKHAFATAAQQGCTNMKIGIVEENTVLKTWYESLGFRPVGTKKSAHFPFTIGFMERSLP